MLFNKILIIRQSSIGDIILTTPLVRSVRQAYPEAQIDFLTNQEFADLVRHNPHVSNVVSYDKKTGFRGLSALKNQLMREKYDWIIDLHNSLRSRYLRMFSKIFSNVKEISVYQKPYIARKLLINFKKDIYPKPYKKVLLKYFDALSGHISDKIIQYDNKGTEVFFAEENTKKIDELLENKILENKIPQNKHNIITICPAASAFTKQWLPEYFATLIKNLIEHYCIDNQDISNKNDNQNNKQNSLKIVLLGGKADVSVCENIVKMVEEMVTISNKSMLDLVNSKVVILAGKCNLLDSAALLARSNVIITNDTGMMHLAEAQKKPVLGIFGSTVEAFGFYPFLEKSEIVEENLACRPCSQSGENACPKGHFKCMKNILPEKIYEIALKMMP